MAAASMPRAVWLLPSMRMRFFGTWSAWSRCSTPIWVLTTLTAGLSSTKSPRCSTRATTPLTSAIPRMNPRNPWRARESARTGSRVMSRRMATPMRTRVSSMFESGAPGWMHGILSSRPARLRAASGGQRLVLPAGEAVRHARHIVRHDPRPSRQAFLPLLLFGPAAELRRETRDVREIRLEQPRHHLGRAAGHLLHVLVLVELLAQEAVQLAAALLHGGTEADEQPACAAHVFHVARRGLTEALLALGDEISDEGIHHAPHRL